MRLPAALLLAVASFAIAQPATSTAPAIRPAQKVALPPGFKTVADGPRVAMCLPDDEKWVAEVLANPGATTRPTTMPGDLIDKLTATRKDLARDLSADLAMPDTQAVDTMLDTKLLPRLKRLDEIRPPIVYLVSPKQKLVDAIKAGWSDPRVRYNRVADDIEFNPQLGLSIDGPMDEQLFPTRYLPEDPVEKRKAMLASAVQFMENQISLAVESEGQYSVQAAVIVLVNDTVPTPPNLKPEEKWFADGLAAIVSSKYLSRVGGIGEADIYRLLTNEPGGPMYNAAGQMVRNDPPPLFPAAKENLLQTPDLSAYRPQALPMLIAARQRKAVRVMHDLVEAGGSGALGKIIAAARANPPKDNAAVIALIKTATGVDVTEQLKAH